MEISPVYLANEFDSTAIKKKKSVISFLQGSDALCINGAGKKKESSIIHIVLELQIRTIMCVHTGPWYFAMPFPGSR